MESTLGQRISMLVESRQVTPAELARRLSKSTTSIYDYVKDKAVPRVDVIMELLRLFPGLNGHWLITGEGDMWLSQAKEFLHPSDPGFDSVWPTDPRVKELESQLNLYREKVKHLESQLSDKEELIMLYREKNKSS